MKPGDDCGEEHEILRVKVKLKLKKVGETTRPPKPDLNQTYDWNKKQKNKHDYTVEVTNVFKGLNLIECLKN